MVSQPSFESFGRYAVLCAGFAVACLLAVVSNARGASPPAKRTPNIVLILIDNLGKDWIGCYGSDENVTPHIDALAASGVRFQHAWVTAMCSTTRAAMLTGRYGFRTGWHTHHDTAIYGGGYFDWEREITFARTLQSAGYATAITGKWQLNDLYDQSDALLRHGFDEHLVWTGALIGDGIAQRRWKKSLVSGRHFENRYWDPVVFRNKERVEVKGRFGPDLYVEYLIEFMQRHRERPFLAFYSTPMVHVPVVPTPLSDRRDKPEREQFSEMVRFVDQQVGQLVSALDRLKLREETVVIVTTDNGSPSRLGGRLRGEKVTGGLGKLTEPGLDVPLIVHWPARMQEGRVSDALIDCTDFLPTIVELAGAELPPQTVLDGHSFAAELKPNKSPTDARDWIFSQYATTRVVRDRQFKLYSSGALFNVFADVNEKTDLSASQDRQVVAARRHLQQVLDSMPGDVQLPFEPRSGSAFSHRKRRQQSGDGSQMELSLLPFPSTTAEVRAFQQEWSKNNRLELNIENSLGIDMVLIPPGELLMGTGNDDDASWIAASTRPQLVDVYLREVPQHRVRITAPFYLCQSPITVAQFRAFVEATGYRTEAEKDGRGGFGMVNRSWRRDPKYNWHHHPGKPPSDDHPVVNVSWNDAVRFSQWLTGKEGIAYRLPTEAEWEYACRAGTETEWYCGADLSAISSIAWYRENSNWSVHPVAQKEPNAFGLHDMVGNVRNWCADWYDEAYYVVSAMDDPSGPTSGTHKVVRGSAFHYRADFVRSATRFRDPPSHRHGQLGFRVCRSVK